MKVLTLTTIGTVAAVLAFSTGCSQSEIDALNTELDDVRTNLVDTKHQLDKAQKSQKDAEREMNVAQDQSETAYVNLHKVQRQLAEQKQRVGQLQRVHSLKMAEYEAFVAKTAQALAAKDKKISELSAPVK